MPPHNSTASSAHGLFFFDPGSFVLLALNAIHFNGSNENQNKEDLGQI